MKKEVKMVSPWVEYYRKLDALFKNDPAIHVFCDNEKRLIKLFIDDTDKATALGQLLPRKKVFGNESVEIRIIPANDDNYRAKLFQEAFKNNPAFIDLQSVDSMGWIADYIIFKKEVVQYEADDLSDINGMRSTLYEDIARDVFEDVFGVYFCTEVTK